MRFRLIEDLEKEVPKYDDEGYIIGTENKVIATNVVSYLDADPDTIVIHREHFNKFGKKYNTRCIVNVVGFGNVIMAHSFAYIIKVKTNHNFKVHGFGRK